ncbi:MAG: cytochrome c oxidase assembly protein [Burkholderiaceae bacterium]
MDGAGIGTGGAGFFLRGHIESVVRRVTRVANHQSNHDLAANRHIVGKLLIMVVAMFAFGYAMVPIYKAICEVTGINLLTRPDDDADKFAKNTQIDSSRKVTVLFDSNSRGAWRFKPEHSSVSVHPGELVTIVYDLVNTSDRQTIGQAIPSYLPTQSAAYFKKIQCFCFDQQKLGPKASRQFPVVFVIDPKLPKDVNTITLSYTYFEQGLPAAPAPAAAASTNGGAS